MRRVAVTADDARVERHYDRVHENGRRLIADIRSMTAGTWDLVPIPSAKLP